MIMCREEWVFVLTTGVGDRCEAMESESEFCDREKVRRSDFGVTS